MAEQVLGAFEGEGQRGAVFDDAVGAGGVFIDDETTAYRIVFAASDLQASGIKGTENHAVGVIGQRFADHCQVELFVEVDAVLTEQVQAPAAADFLQACGNAIGVHGIGVFAFKAQKNGLIAAVALAGGTEGAVQLDFDAGGGGQHAVAA
ncbi:hypothetical protein D3C85_1229540 [compost metagenome]